MYLTCQQKGHMYALEPYQPFIENQTIKGIKSSIKWIYTKSACFSTLDAYMHVIRINYLAPQLDQSSQYTGDKSAHNSQNLPMK